MSKMTDKLTPNTMKNQYDHQWNVFCKKNHDYGNSFEKSLDTFGLVAGIVRMGDKFERLVSLNDPSKDAQIASESLVDTLEDLSNYAAMAACWLKRKKERNWAKERLTAIKKEGVPVCKELEETILKSVDDKIKAAEIYSRDNNSIDIESGKVIYKPQFTGIKLFGPKELELNLKEEIDQDKLFEISNALHPSNLPKSVKVNYGHKAVYEFPDGIDTIASYLQQLSREEAKKENDRVMLDMMLSRIEKGEVVRIVANGDGSFTTYFEKTDGPFDKIVDKEDESIYHEREGWEEEVKLEGQNGSSVTFTDGNGIFSFGSGSTVRSLGDITLTAGPKEKKKTLNEIRKERGFDPVNGKEDDQ